MITTYMVIIATFTLIVALYNIYLLVDTSKLFKDKTQYKLHISREGSALPVIKVFLKKVPYYFIIDTASTFSILDTTTAKKLMVDNPEIKWFDGIRSIIGIGGKVAENTKFCTLEFTCESLSFSQEFTTASMSKQMASTNEHYGIKCAGLLGINFFSKYKAKIDLKHGVILISKDDLHSIKST